MHRINTTTRSVGEFRTSNQCLLAPFHLTSVANLSNETSHQLAYGGKQASKRTGRAIPFTVKQLARLIKINNSY